jgi:hypothetical protein
MTARGLLAALAVAALSWAPGWFGAQAQNVPHPSLPECRADDPLLRLPDLVPDVPADARTVDQGSRRVLQFTTAVANIGDGPLVLEGRTISTADGSVTQGYQVIWRRDGSRCARATGRFDFHSGHLHFHFNDFVGYELRQDDPFNGPFAATGSKASFCLLDLARVRSFRAEEFPRQVLNQTCASAEGIQGISVGWKDVYERILPGQSINLDSSAAEQVPAGTYFLVNVVDPNHLLWDKNPDNNASFVSVGIGLPPPDLSGVIPQPTPRAVLPRLRPGRVRPTRPPRLRPTLGPRPARPARAQPTPVPVMPTATPVSARTATPRPGPQHETNCENACSYGVSQARMLWYGALSFSAVISPGSCAALTPDAGDAGTMQMVNFVTERRQDTGIEHVASYVLGDGGGGNTSAGGAIQFSRVVDSYRVTYSAPIPAAASQHDGADFPVVFDLCLTLGEQAVKTRLVCQPKNQGMLCHEG